MNLLRSSRLPRRFAGLHGWPVGQGTPSETRNVARRRVRVGNDLPVRTGDAPSAPREAEAVPHPIEKRRRSGRQRREPILDARQSAVDQCRDRRSTHGPNGVIASGVILDAAEPMSRFPLVSVGAGSQGLLGDREHDEVAGFRRR
jgi:hypothetical protein